MGAVLMNLQDVVGLTAPVAGNDVAKSQNAAIGGFCFNFGTLSAIVATGRTQAAGMMYRNPGLNPGPQENRSRISLLKNSFEV